MPRIERRQHPRHPVSWRVRLWVLGELGFVEGRACDASTQGMGVEVSPRVPSRFLIPGERHRLDVYEESGVTSSRLAEIRYVAGRSIGLQIIEPGGPELRQSWSAPAEPAPLVRDVAPPTSPVAP